MIDRRVEITQTGSRSDGARGKVVDFDAARCLFHVAHKDKAKSKQTRKTWLPAANLRRLDNA